MPYIGRNVAPAVNAEALNDVYPLLTELYAGSLGIHIAEELIRIISNQVQHPALNALLLSAAGGYQRGDIDNDGSISTQDAIEVLRWIAGLDDAAAPWIKENIITAILKDHTSYTAILDLKTLTLYDTDGVKRVSASTSGISVTGNATVSGRIDTNSIKSWTGTIEDASGNVRSGRKNLIINGGFDVWQRGTSGTSTTAYIADRWSQNTYTGGTFTFSKQTDSDPSIGTYAEWDRTVEDTAHLTAGNIFQQTIENATWLSGKTVTLSFMMKRDDSVGVSTNIRIYGSPWTSLGSETLTNQGNTWNKYEATFTLSTFTTDHIQVQIRGASGGVSKVSLTNVQLEVGSVATDFEHRSYGEELALCQRYYQRYVPTDTSLSIGRGYCGANPHCMGDFQFPVMRTTPTFSSGQAHAGCVGDVTLSSVSMNNGSIGYFYASSNVAAEYYVKVASLSLDAEL
jgi:hypothetical protein